eukprot:366544-Chlamydomonas_euryale.AAC.7
MQSPWRPCKHPGAHASTLAPVQAPSAPLPRSSHIDEHPRSCSSPFQQQSRPTADCRARSRAWASQTAAAAAGAVEGAAGGRRPPASGAEVLPAGAAAAGGRARLGRAGWAWAGAGVAWEKLRVEQEGASPAGAGRVGIGRGWCCLGEV